MPPDRSRWAALLLLLVRNSEPLVPPARPPSHAKLYAAAATVQRRPRQVNRPLLTWAEEKQLGRECQRLAGLETIRVAEAERLEREPTRCEWAKAANYTSENDMKADRLRMRACRDELISRNLRLVLSVAGRYARQPGLDFDDLVAEGNFGLAKAAARFDPEKGFRFSTYAVWWIRQAVSHAIGHDARTIRLPAHVHDKLRRMRRLREDFRAEHGRDPEHEEVAAGLGMDPSKVKRIARAAREVVSTDGSASRGGPSKGSGAAERTAPRVADLLADETQSPDAPPAPASAAPATAPPTAPAPPAPASAAPALDLTQDSPGEDGEAAAAPAARPPARPADDDDAWKSWFQSQASERKKRQASLHESASSSDGDGDGSPPARRSRSCERARDSQKPSASECIVIE